MRRAVRKMLPVLTIHPAAPGCGGHGHHSSRFKTPNSWWWGFLREMSLKPQGAVHYDPRTDKNVLDAVFRCGAMPTY